MKKTTGLVTFMTLAVELNKGWAVAQVQPRKSDGPPKFKMTTESPPGIASPNKVDSRWHNPNGKTFPTRCTHPKTEAAA